MEDVLNTYTFSQVENYTGNVSDYPATRLISGPSSQAGCRSRTKKLTFYVSGRKAG